jgi:hypothetical protein
MTLSFAAWLSKREIGITRQGQKNTPFIATHLKPSMFRGSAFPLWIDVATPSLKRLSYTHTVSVATSHPRVNVGIDPPKGLGTIPL